MSDNRTLDAEDQDIARKLGKDLSDYVETTAREALELQLTKAQRYVAKAVVLGVKMERPRAAEMVKAAIDAAVVEIKLEIAREIAAVKRELTLDMIKLINPTKGRKPSAPAKRR